MAKLAKYAYDCGMKTIAEYQEEGGDPRAWLTAQNKVWEELQARSDGLPPGEVVGGLLKFQVADGYAVYVVTKATPLTLTHVPFGDAYQVHDALIRGLRRADVLASLERDRKLSAIFAKKKAI